MSIINLRIDARESERVRESVKQSHCWKKELEDANLDFAMGGTSLKNAAWRYGFIFETFLKNMYKELYMAVSSADKDNLHLIEMSINRKPVGEFTFGNLIKLYEATGFLAQLKNLFALKDLEPKRMYEISDTRIDSIHEGDEQKKLTLDKIRLNTTEFLLQIGFIKEDPFPAFERRMRSEEIEKDRRESEAERKKRNLEMQKIAQQIRLRIAKNDKTLIEDSYTLEERDGWLSADVYYKAEIVGLWYDYAVDEDLFKVIVRIIDSSGPDSEWPEFLEKIGKRIRDIVAEGMPDVENMLQIFIFDHHGFDKALQCADYDSLE